MTEITINLDSISPIEFFGTNNVNFNELRKAFPHLKIASRGNKIKVAGNKREIEEFEARVKDIVLNLEKFGKLSPKQWEYLIRGMDPEQGQVPGFPTDVIVYGPNGHIVKARTVNQKQLVDKAKKNDVVFAIGPAGTGKTYSAVALAVKALKGREVKKIILTRPAVEAGESLGFLPGDLKEKVDPYLRPLYDGLSDMLPHDKLAYYMTNGVIEVAPLAYMRGRTLDNAFIILDEAQNTTESQLKMFLTRLGPNAKCIITGDLSQVDLPKHQRSGLFKALDRLQGIKGIGFIFLDTSDVVRHKLVKHIITAFQDEGEKEIDQSKLIKQQ